MWEFDFTKDVPFWNWGEDCVEYIIENDHLDADEIVDEAEQLTIRQDTMLKKK